jgi:hypothetical protein
MTGGNAWICRKQRVAKRKLIRCWHIPANGGCRDDRALGGIIP